MNSPLLILLLLIPAAGALIGAMLPIAAARSWALLISLATLLVAVIIGCQFQFDVSGFQFKFDNAHFVLPFNASFSLGIDAISLWLILLTALLMPLAVSPALNRSKIGRANITPGCSCSRRRCWVFSSLATFLSSTSSSN